jgi:hypothetical protein
LQEKYDDEGPRRRHLRLVTGYDADAD